MSSGVAGRTNYSEWEKKTSSLLSELENETEKEIEEAKTALGSNGKYPSSKAEAKERQKQNELQQKKEILNQYQEREMGVVQVLTNVLDDKSPTTKYITREDMGAGKRVLNITNTNGPGHIILTQDLTNLQSNIPTNSNLTPKSYPQDAENDAPSPPQSKPTNNHTIHGLIKVSLTNLQNCTVTLRCKVITGLLEVSHCTNVIVKSCQDSTIVTVQADLCKNLDIQFHDAPSGKSLSKSNLGVDGLSGNNNSGIPLLPTNKNMYWGDDKDDRIFHAGVSNLKVSIYRDGIIERETSFDYQKDGNAIKIGNASAEEVQFVSSVVGGELLTEKVLRQGSATGTTVGDGVDGNGGGGARAMTEREMKEVEKRKESIRKAVDARLGGIKIVDKDGKEVPVVRNSNATQDSKEGEEVTDEVYTSMSSSNIENVVKDCEAQKAKGNEAFVAGEYAQAVLLYTLALDRAAELPDASSFSSSSTTATKQLFPRHVVLSNRSASFLKLGHHDKALADGIEAEKLDPNYVKGVFRKGLALHALGRYQEALGALSTALRIEPKNKQIKQALQFAEVRFQQELRKRTEG